MGGERWLLLASPQACPKRADARLVGSLDDANMGSLTARKVSRRERRRLDWHHCVDEKSLNPMLRRVVDKAIDSKSKKYVTALADRPTDRLTVETFRLLR